jgi:hypothetical protein
MRPVSLRLAACSWAQSAGQSGAQRATCRHTPCRSLPRPSDLGSGRQGEVPAAAPAPPLRCLSTQNAPLPRLAPLEHPCCYGAGGKEKGSPGTGHPSPRPCPARDARPSRGAAQRPLAGTQAASAGRRGLAGTQAASAHSVAGAAESVLRSCPCWAPRGLRLSSSATHCLLPFWLEHPWVGALDLLGAHLVWPSYAASC